MRRKVDDERRRSPRVPAELRLEFKHLGRPNETFEDLTRDLSEGGVFVATTVGLELGVELALEIAPGPGAAPIRMRAEVVRVEEEPVSTGSKVTTRARGMALRFKHADPAELARLLELTERMQREAKEADAANSSTSEP